MSGSDLDEEAIFNIAREFKTPEARLAYLNECCGGNPELFERVSELLQAFLEDGDFLESPANVLEDTNVAAAIKEAPGSIIGPYKLEELIGSGGMGLVYRAEQQWPVRRLVALKIIKPGMDTRQVVARFEAERQALAMMDHPNIARMLDAGTTDSGRPYFVMELVRGIMITRHCDDAGLQTRERLQLFVAVCEGVQHAHQNGIIHRDIKPHNVLVTLQDGRPVPKVIDFGVAKAITPAHQEWTQQSLLMHMVGTPIYMSPEQAQFGRSDVDTRCDIYSLGALLYEMLTGVPPFDKQRMQEAGYEEMLRIIREEEPQRPSIRVAELRAMQPVNGLTDSGLQQHRFQQALRDDLDWIVVKTLEKDRERRYDSVSSLIADIKRYLSDTPVEARRPSLWYRLRKFARRRKSLFALLTISTVFFLVALGTLISSYVLIARERREMLKQRDIARAHEKTVIAREETIRDYLYAADMQLGYLAWQKGDLQQVRTKLNNHVPETEPDDQRGFEWHFLSRLMENRSQTWRGHVRDVFDVQFSNDGKLLASCCGDTTLRLWNTADGSTACVLSDFKSDTNAVSFSRDGKLFITSEEDLQVRVWETERRREIAKLSGFELPVARAYLAADQRTVVATEIQWLTTNFKISTWDWQTQTRIKTLDGHLMLAYDPNTDRIAARNRDGQLELWSLPELELQFTWPEKQPDLGCAVFSHNGRLLATGTRGGDARLWSVENQSFRQLPNHVASPVLIRSLAFSPDDRSLATAGEDGVARIWDLETLSIQKVFRSQESRYWSVQFSPDGQALALGCQGGPIEVHDLSDIPRAFQRLHSHTVEAPGYPSQGIALDVTGTRLAVIDPDYQSVSILDAETGSLLRRVRMPQSLRCLAIGFSADGSELCWGNLIGEVHRLNLKTDKTSPPIKTGPSQIGDLLISPNGRQFVTDDRKLNSVGPRVWDVQTSELMGELPRDVIGMPAEFHTIHGFGNESVLLASQGRQALRWNPKTRQELTPRLLHGQRVFCMALTPDETLLLTGTEEGTISIWDLGRGELQGILLGHRSPVIKLSISPDGRTLASGSILGEVKLWHIPTLQPLCDLYGLYGCCRFLSFAPDGRRLFVAGDLPDKKLEIAVWNGFPTQQPTSISQKQGNSLKNR